MNPGDAIPRLDLRDLRSEDPAALATLAAACSRWGFFHLAGHGLDDALTDALFRATQALFALPREALEAVRRTDANARGYNPAELTKNRRDWKEIFDFGHKPAPEQADDAPANRVLDGHNQFPAGAETLRADLEAWYTACEPVAFEVLHAVARSLDLPGDAFDGLFRPSHSAFLRLNRYAPCPDPAPADAPTLPETGELGIHHHTDAGALTLLIQRGPASLQVEHAGRWIGVQPEPDCLIVNIGDMIQVLTNDAYVAPLHRVLAHGAEERFSAAYFFNPDYDACIRPRGTRTPAYRPLYWRDFRSGRAAGDYADLGAEIQIADYRIAAQA